MGFRQAKLLSPKAAGLLRKRKRVRVKSASLRPLLTSQGMVRPIHDWLMTILSLIRKGTLNQLRPLSFIPTYYSFYLKGGNRLTVSPRYQGGAIFGYDFAAAWMT